MTRYRLLLVLLVGVCLTEAASAGIFFRKKQPSPTRLQELIGILKTDQNESKRADAAAELGGYDGKAHPEVVPVLTEALMRDPSANVHVQAVESLGKIRPVSQEAGQALEYALANDSSTRVRLQARATLLQYRVAGYRSAGNEGPKLAPAPPAGNREPPLADSAPERVTPPSVFPSPNPPAFAPSSPPPSFVPSAPPAPPMLVAPQPASRYVPVPGGIRPYVPSPQPPAPANVAAPAPASGFIPLPQPVPAAQPTLVPAQPPALEAPPAAAPPSEDGPSLNAPK